MALLTRDQILQANDIQSRTIAVPEWGGEVRVRGLTGTERDRYEASLLQERKGGGYKQNLRNARTRLVVLGCVDEQGRRLFNDGDIEALAARSAAALERVFAAIREMSGMTEADIEELTENFDKAAGDDSYSA